MVNMSESASRLLTRAMQHKDLGEYKKAQECIDLLLEAEPENYIAWYEKSKLPIIQDDTITVKNRSVSLSVYQRLPLPDRNSYLQQCGFDITDLLDIESSLCAPNLIAAQNARYLKMAIRYAPEQAKIIYEAELNAIAFSDKKRKRAERQTVIILGLVALPISVVVALVLILFPSLRFFEKPLHVIMILAVPYILSITGIAFYGKAKSNGTTTALGFVCNLVAVIISVLSIINAVFTFWVK